jgi:hypothetical protein
MFETCVNRRSELSAFRNAGIHANDSSPVLCVADECAASDCTGVRISALARWLLVPHRSSASIATVFRIKRHAAKPQNAADCLQFAATCPVLAARLRLFARHLAMCLKHFNARRFWSRSDSGILISPQAAIQLVARFWIASLRSQ